MKTKSSRRTLSMTSSSDGSLLAPALQEELSSAWNSLPSLVEGGREWPRKSDWAPEVRCDDHGRYKASCVGEPPDADGEHDGGRCLSHCCLKDVRRWLAAPPFR